MKKVSCILLVYFCINVLTAQEGVGQIIDFSTISDNGIVLNDGWKFQAGDNPAYALPDYDDSMWEPIDPTLDIYDLPQMRNTPIGWLRIHLHVDSSLLNKPLAFQIRQHLASEIYVNGTSVKKYGTVSADPQIIEAYQPQFEPFGIYFTSTDQVVAVRFSYQPDLPYIGFTPPYNGFILRMAHVEGASAYVRHDMRFNRLNYIEAGLFLLLFLFHLSYFVLYPKQKANLFFALSTFFAGIGNILYVAIKNNHDVAFITYAAVVDYILLWPLYGLFLFLAVHTLFSSRKGWSFWFVVALFPLGIPFLLISYKWGFVIGLLVPLLIGTAEAFRISLLAYRNDKKGVGIVITGLGGYFILFSLFSLMLYGILPFGPPIIGEYVLMDFIYHLSVVSIPISLSIYLSLQYAYTSKDLEKKLTEVQELSEKTIAQEQEKKQILASQKETLEKQVTERTAQLKQSLSDLKATQSQLIQSEKLAALGQLTAGIAHEIKNPLNFVNNFSEVSLEMVEEARDEVKRQKAKVKREKESPFEGGAGAKAEVGDDAISAKNEDSALILEILDDIEMNLRKIHEHGSRADGIVKSMLQHSRGGDGKMEPASLNPIIKEYVNLAFHGMRAGKEPINVDIDLDLDESVGEVPLIAEDFSRVILNLCNNAFDAMREKQGSGDKAQGSGGYKPKLTVRTKSDNGKVMIEIEDNGPGIPDEIKDKIMQPFFTTKKGTAGTGLGLSITNDIINAHGGVLQIKSDQYGSQFSIIINL